MRVKDIQTFEQLEEAMGKDKAVLYLTEQLKALDQNQLYVLEQIARNRFRKSRSNKPYQNFFSAIPDIISAITISGVRKELNSRRDEIEAKIKKEIESMDDKTLYECINSCEKEEAERFRRVRNLYKKLKKFGRKFRSRKKEYRWEYESTLKEYKKSKGLIHSFIQNHLCHPNQTDGEYSFKVKISNRSKIKAIKEKMKKIIEKNGNLSKLEYLLEKNLAHQNFHQSREKEDFYFVKNVLLRICSHNHEFEDCKNYKDYKDFSRSRSKILLGFYYLTRPEIIMLNFYKIKNKLIP